jgi:cell shape-determining protein MreD
MIAFCIYLILGLTAIVAQTTILTLPVFHGLFYDLLIPLVVFLGLRLRDGRGLLVVAILGMIMDLLSGGIFGLYFSVYLWIFLSVKSVSRYFNVDDKLFQSILIAACVFGEHIVFCVFLAPPWKDARILVAQTTPILLQLMLAALTGSRVYVALDGIAPRIQARLSTPGEKPKAS